MTPIDDDRLAELRRDIDRIDSAMVALLAERQAVSRRIGEVKAASDLLYRPGREARVLRRLVDEVAGKVDQAAVVGLWREIFAASTRTQGAFAVAVCAPTGERPIWDLARNHFGGATPLVRVERPAQALRALTDESVQVAVLPPPGDEVLWWTGLIEASPRLHVVARLPFGVFEKDGGNDGVEAFAVSPVWPDPSDADASLLAVNAPAGVSRGRLKDLLAEAGLESSPRAATRPPGSQEAWHLIEVDGFVEESDARLANLAREHGREVERCVRVGAFAKPLATRES
jgi:chorismate mutase / prephenate dehydratase